MSIVEKKRNNAIQFFASKSHNGSINRLKLIKLLWLADRIHLNRYGRFILRDKYKALPHGPVPSATLDIANQPIENFITVEGYNLISEAQFDSKYFSKSDLRVLNEVWEKYGELSQYELRDFSHKFPEWQRFENQLSDAHQPNSYSIVVDDFFSPPSSDVDYQHDGSISEESKKKFHTYNSILSSLSE